MLRLILEVMAHTNEVQLTRLQLCKAMPPVRPCETGREKLLLIRLSPDNSSTARLGCLIRLSKENSVKRKALISGITGQDGSYLAEFLLA